MAGDDEWSHRWPRQRVLRHEVVECGISKSDIVDGEGSGLADGNSQLAECERAGSAGAPSLLKAISEGDLQLKDTVLGEGAAGRVHLAVLRWRGEHLEVAAKVPVATSGQVVRDCRKVCNVSMFALLLHLAHGTDCDSLSRHATPDH